MFPSLLRLTAVLCVCFFRFRHSLSPLASSPPRYAEDLEDASNELMLADGETVKYSYGWVFVHMTDDTAEEKLQTAAEEVEMDICELEGKQERERWESERERERQIEEKVTHTRARARARTHESSARSADIFFASRRDASGL